ncbi:MAG: helix-hairpin-helix domain-containing protein [Gemmatimonadaceae bacterium]
MPTPAERRALIFLAALAATGAAVRGVAAIRGAAPVPADALVALDRQRAAVDSVAAEHKGRRGGRGRHAPKDSLAVRVDLDRAAAAELQALPRVGAGLAGRIVADRDSLGPFGSLEELRRVRGVGCALLATLAPHVTFSGSARLSRGDENPAEGMRTPCDVGRLRTSRLK